jgi:hypothetical protein
METLQAIETLREHSDKKCSLTLTLKHGEVVALLGGLIEIQIDLEEHKTKPMLRFKAPKFVDIFRIKRS